LGIAIVDAAWLGRANRAQYEELEGWHAALMAGRSCGALRALPAPVLRRTPAVRVVVEETTIGSGDRLSGD
jgi:hypothetical protein